MKKRMFLLGCAALGALAACGDSRGALSQASFGAACTPGHACAQGIDAPIAVGASLPLSVDLDIAGTTAPPLTLESVVPDVFELQGATAVARNPGVGALLVTGPDGLVLDFIHLWVAQADRIEASRRAENGELLGRLPNHVVLLPGDELLLSVEPYAGSQRLAGEAEVTWTTGEAPPAVVIPAAVGHWYRLVARTPGTMQLTMRAFEISATYEVEVLP